VNLRKTGNEKRKKKSRQINKGETEIVKIGLGQLKDRDV